MKIILTFLFVSLFSLFSSANTPLLLDRLEPNIDRNPGHRCHYPNAGCVQLGCFYDHCDFDSEIETLTKICNGVYDTGCVRTLCNHRGDCSFLKRFVKYAEMCGNPE